MSFYDIFGYIGLFMMASILFYYLYRSYKHDEIEIRNLKNQEK